MMSNDSKNDNPVAPSADMVPTANVVPNSDEMKQWLYPVQDPEIHMSLVGLGLIYECNIKPVTENQFNVGVIMTLTSPGCPMAAEMVGNVRTRVLEYPGAVDVDVQIVMEPKWDPRTMASEEVKEALNIW